MPENIEVSSEQALSYLNIEVPAGVSNRHVHLSLQDFHTLFGEEAELHLLKSLGQPGEFACQESLTVIGPRGVIEQVRVIGPIRSATQVEVTMTDAFRLGYKPPVRDSGNIDKTPGITIAGPKGVVILQEGLILAQRHIHMHTSDAEKLGLKNYEMLRVHVSSVRGIIFENVLLRVRDTYALEFHVDTDEANACLLRNGDIVKILR